MNSWRVQRTLRPVMCDWHSLICLSSVLHSTSLILWLQTWINKASVHRVCSHWPDMTDLFALFFTPMPLKQPSYSWDSWLWQQDLGVNNRYRVQMSKYNKTKEQMDRLGQKIRNACTLMPKNKCDSLSITFFFFFTSDKTGNIKILNRSPPQQSSLNDYRAAWRTPLIIYVSF